MGLSYIYIAPVIQECSSNCSTFIKKNNVNNSRVQATVKIGLTCRTDTFYKSIRDTIYCDLTWAHMRIISVLVLSQSIKTFTTWIRP